MAICWYLASIFSFLLATAGKQSVLLLPAVMLVWDLFVERRRNWQMIADKIPFGLITLFFGWMTWHAWKSCSDAFARQRVGKSCSANRPRAGADVGASRREAGTRASRSPR